MRSFGAIAIPIVTVTAWVEALNENDKKRYLATYRSWMNAMNSNDAIMIKAEGVFTHVGSGAYIIIGFPRLTGVQLRNGMWILPQ